MITKQQLDLATRMVLEQFLLLSNGDFQRSTMLQLLLHCFDGTAELNTAFGSIREGPEHPEENKIPSSRVVDLVANDSVRSNTDDRCNTCCHGEARRQEAVVHLSLHPVRLHRKETTFNDVGTTTANGKLKIHMDPTLCAVSLFRSCAFSLAQSEHMRSIWNPMLELLCHAHIGVFMEALFDEEDLRRIAHSCHFALDILCDNE